MSKDKIWHLFARKLAGEASSAELEELEKLERDDPATYAAMQNAAAYWQIPTSFDADYAEATYQLHTDRMRKLGVGPEAKSKQDPQEGILKRRRLGFIRRRTIWIAAFTGGSILAAFLIIFNWPNDKSTISSQLPREKEADEMSTKNGSNTHFLLPDGSHVWLNAGSKLVFTKVKAMYGSREVDLKGEAFFDVVRNVDRPFIIHTSTMDIKVLGTSLNVKAYPNEKTVETSLIHGKVEVVMRRNPAEKYILKPDQKLILPNEDFEANNKAEQSANNPQAPVAVIKKLTYFKGDTTAVETLWTHNKLSFDQESFYDLSKKMERWYDIEFIFKNEDIKEVLFSGSFEGESISQALEALQFSSNYHFKYQVEGRFVFIK